MAKKAKRLIQAAKEFNIGRDTIVEFLQSKGIDIESNPNTKLPEEAYDMLLAEFQSDKELKEKAGEVKIKITRNERKEKEEKPEETVLDDEETNNNESEEELIIKNNTTKNVIKTEVPKAKGPKVVGKIDIDKKEEVKEKTEVEPEVKAESEEITTKTETVENETKVESESVEETKNADTKESSDKAQEEKATEDPIKVVGKVDLDSLNQATRPKKKTKKEKKLEKEKIREAEKEILKKKEVEAIQKQTKEENKEQELEQNTSEKENTKDDNFISTKVEKLSGPTVLGKIELPKEAPKKDSKEEKKKKKKRKRVKKIDPEKVKQELQKNKEKERGNKKKKKKKKNVKVEINEEDVQKQIKETLARLQSKGKSTTVKHKREKRASVRQKQQEEAEKQELEKSILKVTEFITVSELASMMDVSPTDVIATCMNLGMFVSINQRLDAETIVLVADEYNFDVEFISADLQDVIEEEEDKPEDLVPRPPIVTVMGHVDHGKTKLLDYIRNTNVIAGEAGGITQHIGAYKVELKDGKKITFLDTPGHEAFTAMRARGAQITDVAIIVIAADDGIKPQTVEAINHAQAAGVPMVFAINKIDKPTANPDKVKEELANMNILVEDWGGKYQSQEISAKAGTNVDELLEKVLLEAELLELKANPNRKAVGSVIESSLDKGKGYVATVLVQNGTLHQGDIMVAGSSYGHIKAMFNERNERIQEAGPSSPAIILGLNGAPQAGDKFNIFSSDSEAREIANKRKQLQREQNLRAQKHITLDEIGRRLAIGNFQELNVIVKGDVDGSIEALSDSLLKLSNEEIQVNIIHKAVGQISESDVLLATASDAVIIGFQVRPSMAARKLAEKEEVEIRLYSIIYDAINDLKDAIQGMLSPEVKEEIIANLEVLNTFKVSKVGTVAGCMVREGKIKAGANVRVIRDGIVIYTGELNALKRFKDDVKEVVSGLECGVSIKNYNDIKVGDIIEAFIVTEHARKL